MKHVLLVGFGLGLFAASGCVARQSVWSRDPYVPAPQTMRGSQTYSPKTVVSPYQSHGSGELNQWPAAGVGVSSTSGSGSK
jgi:hypothetical protein